MKKVDWKLQGSANWGAKVYLRPDPESPKRQCPNVGQELSGIV